MSKKDIDPIAIVVIIGLPILVLLVPVVKWMNEEGDNTFPSFVAFIVLLVLIFGYVFIKERDKDDK